ncbi:hypothetical protein JQN72_13785 [Phycicoccus sp. CSK15P-2]|uniref:hypothetical protein n=1 Tax=Phycicoccus sp. CSK15P-2 TaxID=2807627 RepID=UPI00195005FC|nr:hypothetical protein [Phycicoccus sp. CSK15P-2]MBM6405311.1 hypothetical protein [Phycicoccus sp. CSK15P-2]
MTSAGEPGRPDRRRARSARTREAIVTAFLELVHEGHTRPTGAQVARRADVSERTLWSNVTDLDTLYEAAGERIRRYAETLAVTIPTDLHFEERLTRFCAQRVAAHEAITPFARANRLRGSGSAAARHNRTRYLTYSRAELEEVFAPELDRLGPTREAVVLHLVTTTTWSAWAVLRDELGLDADTAASVVLAGLRAGLSEPAGPGALTDDG